MAKVEERKTLVGKLAEIQINKKLVFTSLSKIGNTDMYIVSYFSGGESYKNILQEDFELYTTIENKILYIGNTKNAIVIEIATDNNSFGVTVRDINTLHTVNYYNKHKLLGIADHRLDKIHLEDLVNNEYKTLMLFERACVNPIEL